MCDETKSSANLIPLKDRIRAFHDCMVPALHLFPQDIAEKLTESGFFTAPASTKYHGAYEGGLFDHSYNVASALVTLSLRTLSACFMIFVSRINTSIPSMQLSMVEVSQFPLLMKANGNMPQTCFSRVTVINLSCCSPNICS